MNNEVIENSDGVKNTEAGKKIQYKRVRKVGTVTMGLSLIAVGITTVVGLFSRMISFESAVSFIPLILVSFGIEVLIRYFMNKDDDLKYDIMGSFICCVLMFWCFGMTCLIYMRDYWYIH